MSEWQPIETEPQDGGFRLYALHVTHADGSQWLEVHYLAWDDEGLMIEPSGDHFSAWEFSDFEFWAPAPTLPAETTHPIG